MVTCWCATWSVVVEEDRIVGLELGADDYITKPFSPRSLMTGWWWTSLPAG